MIDRKTLMFLVCGGIAAGVNWLARLALSEWMSFRDAVILSYVIGAVVVFFLYRGFVWTGPRGSLLRQAIGFLAVNTVSGLTVVVSAILLRQLASLVDGPQALAEAAAHAAAIALGATTSFFGHGRLTFRPL